MICAAQSHNVWLDRLLPSANDPMRKRYMRSLIAAMALTAAPAWCLPPDTVWVRLTVDATGAVAGAELIQNTGTQAMATAAVKRLRAWHYKPHVVNGRAVPTTTTVEIGFRQRAPTAAPKPR